MSQINNISRRKRLNDRLKKARERMQLLELELKEYTNAHFRVCIFGSARIRPEDHTYKLTEEIAFHLGEEGIDVLTGGGPGLMEAANKGVLAGRETTGSKSRSFGISIELKQQIEPTNDHLDIKHHHRRFSSRLDDFMRLSNAILVMQGGIGTLLELYYSWQLLQVGHMSNRPIVLVGVDFWSGLIEWMKKNQLSQQLISPGDLKWIEIVDSAQEVQEIILPEYAEFLLKRAQK